MVHSKQQEEKIVVQGPCGQLEALIVSPVEEAVRGIAVVCHPHPLHGGTMTNKVVHTAAKALSARNLVTVRFNYRGVGASEGEYADTVGEREDLRAVVTWLQQQYPPQPLTLAGFSFGAYIAIAIAAQVETKALISIAPPVNYFDHSARALQKLPSCPWLIVQGDADDVVPYDDVKRWHDDVASQAEFVTLPGAGHFFHRRLGDLQDTLAHWLHNKGV